MSLQVGQIIGTDLSANANILGTQIADKTLLFRNFSEATFKIVDTDTVSLSHFTIGSGGSGNFNQDDQDTVIVTHGLGYIPAALVYLNDGGASNAIPATFLATNGANSVSWKSYNVEITTTQLIVNRSGITFADTIDFVGDVITYYLLEQSLS